MVIGQEHVLYLHLSSGVTAIHLSLISRCHQKSRNSVAMVWFLLPEGSHPATEDLKPDVLVEAFLSMGHVDLEDFLDWQFSWVFGCVHHCGLFNLMEW